MYLFIFPGLADIYYIFTLSSVTSHLPNPNQSALITIRSHMLVFIAAWLLHKDALLQADDSSPVFLWEFLAEGELILDKFNTSRTFISFWLSWELFHFPQLWPKQLKANIFLGFLWSSVFPLKLKFLLVKAAPVTIISFLH